MSIIGQIRWPDEIEWNCERQARCGWLAIVPHEYLQQLEVKARRWDEMLSVRSQAEEVPNDAVWKRLVRENQLIEAIKECRSTLGCGLREAKDCVEGYRRSFTGATP